MLALEPPPECLHRPAQGGFGFREGLRRLNRTVEIPDPFLDSRRLEKLLCRRRGRLRGRGQRTGRSLKRCHSRRSEQRGATKTRGRSNRACEHLSSDRAHARRSRRIRRWNQRRCALFESRRCIGTRAHSLGGKNPGELLSGFAGSVPDAAHGDAGSAALDTRESNASKAWRNQGRF